MKITYDTHNHTGLKNALRLMKEGVDHLLQGIPLQYNLDEHLKLKEQYLFLTGLAVTLERIDGWDQLPEEQVHTALDACFKSLFRIFSTLAAGYQSVIEEEPLTITGFPAFWESARLQMGPSLRITDDMMKAFVRIDLEEVQLWQPDFIIQWLASKGITQNIHEQNIRDLFINHTYNLPVLVAQGVTPSEGTDGWIEDVVSPNELQSPENEKGQIDFKEVTLFTFVEEGDILQRMIPAKPGKPGKNVFGKPIPPPPNITPEFQLGKNTSVSENGLELCASLPGCLEWLSGVIHVHECLVISSAVSFETGNIETNLDVKLLHGALTDFSVVTSKNIDVKGVVEGAKLQAGGRIHCLGAIQGHNKAVIKADGDVYAKLINEAQVEAKGDVIVEREIVNSTVISGRNVTVKNGNGRIYGGEIIAEDCITAGELGSQSGSKPLLHVARTLSEIPERIEQLVQLKTTLEQRLTDLDDQYILAIIPSSNAENETARQDDIEKMKKSIKQIQEDLNKTTESIEILKKKLDIGMDICHCIHAKTAVWPGVVIQIFDQKMRIVNSMGPTTFTMVGNQIQAVPYQPINNDISK